MELAVGERVEPLGPDDARSFPYCAAQRNLDKIGTGTGRSVPGLGGSPAQDLAPKGGRRKGRERCGTLEAKAGAEAGISKCILTH